MIVLLVFVQLVTLLLHPFYSDSTLLNFLSKKKTWKYSKPKNKVKPYGPGWAWDDYNFYYAAGKSVFQYMVILLSI